MIQSRPRGFHTNLTPGLHAQIVDAVKEYLTVKLVAAALKIPRERLKIWLNRGRRAANNQDDITLEDEIFAQLHIDFEAARAETIKTMIDRVRNHSEEWQASWSILKALEREDFGTDGSDLLELRSQLEELRALITKQDSKQIQQQEDDDE